MYVLNAYNEFVCLKCLNELFFRYLAFEHSLHNICKWEAGSRGEHTSNKKNKDEFL